MMQKIFLSKNKYKILSIFIIFIILIIFAIYLIYQKYNYNYFIEKFENEFDLKVYKKEVSSSFSSTPSLTLCSFADDMALS